MVATLNFGSVYKCKSMPKRVQKYYRKQICLLYIDFSFTLCMLVYLFYRVSEQNHNFTLLSLFANENHSKMLIKNLSHSYTQAKILNS